MITPKFFFDELVNHGSNFFSGVPDSLLKNFCAYVTDNVPATNHIIAANEGNALGIAAGSYLASKTIPVVYMQNSGEGNIVNPLLSLIDEDVYNIPVLFIIGWRGEPGVKDEPQHVKQGKVTIDLLKAMQVEYAVLPLNEEEAKATLERAYEYMNSTNKPFALVVHKGTFEDYKLINKKQSCSELVRETAIKTVLNAIPEDAAIVSTTGHISREVYENRSTHEKDFLTVGSMGHASSIALGIALTKPNQKVFCFDGDGALLMHMGSMPVIAAQKLNNLKHIVFNNEAHDSVGAQPTLASAINLKQLALSSNITKSFSASTLEELKEILPNFIIANGPAFLEVKVKCGARKDLGRPKERPVENKKAFMEFLKDN